MEIFSSNLKSLRYITRLTLPMLPKPGRLALMIFVLAFAVRLVIVWKTGLFYVDSRTEEECIAMNVAVFGEYSDPFGYTTGPTAHASPLYPLFLAGLFATLGTGLLAEVVKVTITSAVSALRCSLVPLFASDAGLDPRIGALAGGISAFYIGALRTEVKGGTDGPWVAIALLALVWASLRIWRDGSSWQFRTPWWFFALCGLAALLNPSILPVIGGFLLVGAVACSSKTRKRYLRQVLLLSLIVFIFLLPWAIRNYVSLDKLIFTRSNFGLEFWLSNGPKRTFDLPTNPGDAFHPSRSSDEAFQVSLLGEWRYNQLKLKEALAWVGAHPREFLHLSLQRFVAWWFPPSPNIVVHAGKIILSLLALLGLHLLARDRPLTAWLFFLTWITFPDIYYLIQWSSRYRYPMDWQLLLCASVALSAAYAEISGFLKTTPFLGSRLSRTR